MTAKFDAQVNQEETQKVSGSQINISNEDEVEIEEEKEGEQRISVPEICSRKKR